MSKEMKFGRTDSTDKDATLNASLKLSLLGTKSLVRMQFDPTKAPPSASNPNFLKSKGVIDARIVQDKRKLQHEKKKLERKFERNFNKWREYDLLTCLIAIVGLSLAIVDWEYTRRVSRRIAIDLG